MANCVPEARGKEAKAKEEGWANTESTVRRRAELGARGSGDEGVGGRPLLPSGTSSCSGVGEGGAEVLWLYHFSSGRAVGLAEQSQ